MDLNILTTDNKLYTLTQDLYKPILLFNNIINLTKHTSPISLKIDSQILDIILKFIPRNHPSNIENFTAEDKKFFADFEIDTLLKICEGANYIGYEFLLEVSASVIADVFKDGDIKDLDRLFGGSMDGKNDHDWFPNSNEE